MIRMETDVVLRYCEALDLFVKVRVFTKAEVSELLRCQAIPNRKGYQDLVINACLIDSNGVLTPRLRAADELAERCRLEEALYRLCVEVNPALDIRQVTIPAPSAAPCELHLLEEKAPARRRDYRRLERMEEAIGERVIGQADAVRSVCRAVKKAMTGLRDPERPAGCFLFVGQTGVGKTELAKALTRYLYQGDLAHLIRVDCSEYALPHEYAKLIGSPPGYIGHQEGGFLTEAVRRQGAAVVLFDEIEKADDKVHDLLLQILDEGFLTDNRGGRVEFRDAILLLTSNLGVDEVEGLRNRAGFDTGKRRTPERAEILRETTEAMKKSFKPEFVNRLDDVVLFNPLGLPECAEIVRLFLGDVIRHAQSVPIELTYSPPVLYHLAEAGYRPEYGAREIRRTVEEQVETPLAEMLVDGRLGEGDRIQLRLAKDRIVFHAN